MISVPPLGADPVSVTELNQATATVLARVKQGEELAVTERGRVVARLVPAQPHPLAHLVARGALHPPTGLTVFPQLARPGP